MLRPKFAAAAMALLGALAVGTADAGVIEDFEDGNITEYTLVGAGPLTVSGAHAHDGSFGLGTDDDGTWIWRDDAPVQVAQGDQLSVWVRFNRVANARAYFGFGASAAGTLSFVLAPNTGDIRFQENPGYGFTELDTASQSFVADKWYRAEVDWGVGGSLTGRLFDSDGTTLLNTVTSSSTLYTSGGIAFRGFSGVKSFDTVSRVEAVPLPPAALLGLGLIGSIGLVGRLRRRKTA